MKCYNCGRDNPVDSNYCINCGEIFKKEKDKVYLSKNEEDQHEFKIVNTIDEVSLLEGKTFDDYIKWIELNEPYGKDRNGIAFLFPNTPKGAHAWRPDFKREDDWGPIKNSGIGWKMNPTFYLALFFFLPHMLISPLFYLIFGYSIELVIADYMTKIIVQSTYLILVIILTKLLGYAVPKMDELLKPYGKEHNSIELLFVNQLEFFKYSKKLYKSVFNLKWFIYGAIGFIITEIYLFRPVYNPAYYFDTLRAPLPYWTIFTNILSIIGIGLLVFFIITFLVAIIYSLFKVTSLGKNPLNLSITQYGNMIKSIKEKVDEAQSKKLKLEIIGKDISVSGRTYYEFQRGNRKIGEFLFNIATILILTVVAFGIGLWIVQSLNILPIHLQEFLTIFTICLTLIGISSLGIFLFPQLSIHKFLKQFKYMLIDSFSSLLARLEYIYFESMIKPKVLRKIDENWNSRDDLLSDINLVKERIEETKHYGTWSYDFPEVMKIIFVALSTIIPAILSFVELPFI